MAARGHIVCGAGLVVFGVFLGVARRHGRRGFGTGAKTEPEGICVSITPWGDRGHCCDELAPMRIGQSRRAAACVVYFAA